MRLKINVKVVGVYPRVGGGNPCTPQAQRKPRGLSPRGRGKRDWKDGLMQTQRSIPAWAGETSAASSRISPMPVYPRVGGGNDVCASST